MPRLGSKRRDALLEHFGSIQKLRKATAEQLSEVAGVSIKLANEIATYLKNR